MKYNIAVKRGCSEQDLIDGAVRYSGDRRVNDGYARDPVTWLNQEGWNDEIEPLKAQAGLSQISRWEYIAKHGSSEGWRSAS